VKLLSRQVGPGRAKGRVRLSWTKDRVEFAQDKCQVRSAWAEDLAELAWDEGRVRLTHVEGRAGLAYTEGQVGWSSSNVESCRSRSKVEQDQPHIEGW